LAVDASRFASWTFAFGGDIYDYSRNEYTFNSPASIAAMSFLQELVANGCARPILETYGDQLDFGKGTTLFTIGSSSGISYYAQSVKAGANFSWSVTTLPQISSQPVVNVYGPSISITKTTRESELAAFLFLKFLNSPQVQAEWAIASSYFPVRASAGLEMRDFLDQNQEYRAGVSLLPYAYFEPPVPGYETVRLEVDAAMNAILDGGDVKTLLTALNDKANQILNNQVREGK
jgi:ABC-type glycerol-3-phosphate transport system substrate-binding protein